MFVKKSNRNKTRGIGLLELMLSLAIIAILLVMATRYFISANESQKINNAISQIHGIAGGAANYNVANHSYTNMKISTLEAGKYIPASFAGSDKEGAGANPWGGNIAVAPAAGAGYTVKLSGVPKCFKLRDMVNGADGSSAACDKDDGGTVTVTFN